MVAGSWPTARCSVDAGRTKPGCKCRAEQQMVDTEAGVALPSMAQVVPERVDALVAMQLSQRIRPTLLEETRVGEATLWLDEGVVVPRSGGVDVDVGRGHVEIAGKHNGNFVAQERAGVGG